LSAARVELVQAQFDAMEGGFHRANVELKAYLRDDWALPALPVLVQESAAALGEAPSERARREHMALCKNVGIVLKQNDRLEPALAHCELALEAALALEGPEEGLSTASCCMVMAGVHHKQRQYDRALELLGRAQAIYDAKDPGSANLATVFNNMGRAHARQKESRQALERYEQGLVIYEAKGDRTNAAATYTNIANLHQTLGDHDKSLEYQSKGLAIYERVHGPHHPLTASIHHNMGGVFLMQGDHAGALEAVHKALAIYEQVYGPQSEPVAHSCWRLATIYAARADQAPASPSDDRQQARAFYERAIAIKPSWRGNLRNPESASLRKMLQGR
jgi:tetratricopeptide (TPR) repeat protein